jgi:hypothetical protein
MKTYNNYPEGFIPLVIKLSTIYVLCLTAMHTVLATAHPLKVFAESEPITSVRQKIREIYSSQIGIREKGYNSGKAVEQYLSYVSLPKGNPWCAAFVCWVFGKAGVENPRSGWSPDLFGDRYVIWDRESAARSQELRHPQSVAGVPWYTSSLATDNWQPAYRTGRLATPIAGDIFGLYFPDKKRIAHAGFVDQWDGTWMISVEGNTNVSGSREGDGVYRKRRLVRTVYKVARYLD